MSGDQISLDQSYDAYPRIEAAFQASLDESLDPRGPEVLYELVDALQLPRAATVVDIGCGEGDHTIELARRFGLDVHGVDPVKRHLELGRRALERDGDLVARVSFTAGNAEDLPVKDASIDLLWCREALMYVHLGSAFAEFHRALRPGGHGLVYQVFTGPRMSDDEAHEFWQHLGAVASSIRPQDIEEAMNDTGLLVKERIELGSEWGERAEETNAAGSRRLLHTARLLRDPNRYIAQFGEPAYRIMLGDCLWHVYRMVGKLTGCAYIFTRPLR